MTGKLWREQLREWDETSKPTAIAKHRELQSVDPDALSDEELVDYLARCRDHHAAMITQHMRYTASAVVPDRRLPRPRRRLDGPAAGGAARADARRLAGLGRRVGRARAAHRGDRGRPGRPGAARLRRRPGGRRSRRFDHATARPAPRCRRISTSSATGCSTASTSRSPRRSSCPTAAAGDPRPRSPAAPRTDDVEASIADGPRARCPRSTATSSTSCSARPGSSTGSATSAASSATSGPRGSCAAQRSAPGAGPPPPGGSTSPSTCSTPASTRCSDLVRGTGGPSADELAARAAYRATHSAKDAPATLGPPAAAAAGPVGPAARRRHG